MLSQRIVIENKTADGRTVAPNDEAAITCPVSVISPAMDAQFPTYARMI